jgi:sugar lactone lactonase YvrE
MDTKLFKGFFFSLTLLLPFLFLQNVDAAVTESKLLPINTSTYAYQNFQNVKATGTCAISGSSPLYAVDSTLNRIMNADVTDITDPAYTMGSSISPTYNSPSAAELDCPTMKLYVVDTNNHRVLVFDTFSGNLVQTIGEYGSGDGQFSYPSDIAINASTGTFYITDTGNYRIQRFNSSGNFVTKWGTYGSGNGQFTAPYGIGVDTSSYVYITDPGTNRIQKFSGLGVYQSTWGPMVGFMDFMNQPTGIALDVSGTDSVFVADSGNNRILKFSRTGTLQGSFGSQGLAAGQFNNIDGLSTGSGLLYVSDKGNKRVQIFDTYSNSSLFTYGTKSNADGLFALPSAMTVDNTQNVFVVDKELGRIQKFSSAGAYITKWGSIGSGNSQFNSPESIARDSAGNIFVADSGNYRVQKFSNNGVYMTQWGAQGSSNGQFQRYTNVTVDSSDNVYVSDGTRIQKFDNNGNYISQWSSNVGDIAFGNNAIWGVYYVGSTGNSVKRYDVNGSLLSTYTQDLPNYAKYVAVSSIGDFYVFGRDSYSKLKIDGSLVRTVNGLPANYYNIVDSFVSSTDTLFFAQEGGDLGFVVKILDGFSIQNLVGDVDAQYNGYSIKAGAYATEGSNVNVNLVASNVVVSNLSVDMTTDRDWSAVEAGGDITTGRTFVSNLNPVDAPGASSTHSLYVPKLAGQTSVYICPTATALNEVYLGCPGGYNLSEGSPSLSVVNVSGQDYWVISGLTGTGALGLSQLGTSFTLIPNNSAVSSTQEVVMSYGTTTGFAALDKVQFHFEPTAGFVLANTCATPTTDSNNDLTVDGAGAIVGSDVYEYTFSDTVTGPSTVSFCVRVTSPATAGSYSVRLTDDNGSFGSSMYYVGDDNDVFVIANVAPSLSFNIRTLADDADTNVCSFGTVSPSDTLPNYDNVDDGASECGYALAVGTNAANGFQVQLTANHELSSTSASIAPITNGVGFVAGVEAYGLANVTSSTSGRNVTTGIYDQSILKDGNFNLAANTGTNIPLSATNFVSYTNGIQYVAGVDSLDTTSVMHGLVIGSGTPAGYYDQVVTYTTTANF